MRAVREWNFTAVGQFCKWGRWNKSGNGNQSRQSVGGETGQFSDTQEPVFQTESHDVLRGSCLSEILHLQHRNISELHLKAFWLLMTTAGSGRRQFTTDACTTGRIEDLVVNWCTDLWSKQPDIIYGVRHHHCNSPTSHPPTPLHSGLLHSP